MARYRSKQDNRGNKPGVGRPIGSTGPRKSREVVQVLKPKHDRFIMLHIAGYSNIEISTITGDTPEYVGQVLLDPKSQDLIQEARTRVRGNLMDSIEDKLVVLAHKSVDNLAKTVNAEIPVRHPMKRHQDKVGLDLLTKLGYGLKSNDEIRRNTISQESIDRLAKALEGADRVGGIEITSGQGIEIQEAIVVNTKTGTDG